MKIKNISVSMVVAFTFGLMGFGQSVLAAHKTPKVVPNSPFAKQSIEMRIRFYANKPYGVLTGADLEKVKRLYLAGSQITDVRSLAGLRKLEVLSLENNNLTYVSVLSGLKQLKYLYLHNNPKLTRTEIAKLERALSRCKIYHNSTK